jgi:O-antigen ligase
MKRVLEYLFAAIIFLTPSNLFLKYFIELGYTRGLFIDYLLPKLYLSDIFIFAFIAVAIYCTTRKTLQRFFASPIILLLLILFIYQLFTEKSISGLWYFVHLIKIILLFFLLQKNTFLVKSFITKIAIVSTLLFQSFLGLYQFVYQKSLFGYVFLGEQNLSQTLGIVRQQIGKHELILPYGTTAHPNILGGILALFYIICLWYWKFVKNKKSLFSILFYCATPLVWAVIWMTQSFTAGITLILGVLLFAFSYAKKFHYFPGDLRTKTVVKLFVGTFICVPFLLHFLNAIFPTSLSIQRRDILNYASVDMTLDHPVLGVGLNQFTSHLEEYTKSSEIVRFVQPVHHIGLLWLAETGLLGLCILALSLQRLIEAKRTISIYILLIIPIAVLDHYFLTLQSGGLLLILSLFIFTAIHTAQE